MYLCINVMQCNAMHVCMYACIYTYLFKTHTHIKSTRFFQGDPGGKGDIIS